MGATMSDVLGWRHVWQCGVLVMSLSLVNKCMVIKVIIKLFSTSAELSVTKHVIQQQVLWFSTSNFRFTYPSSHIDNLLYVQSADRKTTLNPFYTLWLMLFIFEAFHHNMSSSRWSVRFIVVLYHFTVYQMLPIECPIMASPRSHLSALSNFKVFFGFLFLYIYIVKSQDAHWELVFLG